MTHDDFKRWSKIANIVASILVPVIVLSALLFFQLVDSEGSDIIDSLPGFYVFLLFANGALTLGTLIYIIAKQKQDLLSRFFWMLANTFFLFLATVIAIIIGLSHIW